jgi:hypothetical protein
MGMRYPDVAAGYVFGRCFRIGNRRRKREVVTMASSQSNGGGKNERIALSLCLAAGLAVAAWGGGAGRSDAAGFPVPGHTARDGIVLAQKGPATDKQDSDKDEADKKAKSEDQSRRPKRRAIRCGGPGLPECPM